MLQRAAVLYTQRRHPLLEVHIGGTDAVPEKDDSHGNECEIVTSRKASVHAQSDAHQHKVKVEEDTPYKTAHQSCRAPRMRLYNAHAIDTRCSTRKPGNYHRAAARRAMLYRPQRRWDPRILDSDRPDIQLQVSKCSRMWRQSTNGAWTQLKRCLELSRKNSIGRGPNEQTLN